MDWQYAHMREMAGDPQPEADVDHALAELRKLEGGFVAQATFDDWVGFPSPIDWPERSSDDTGHFDA